MLSVERVLIVDDEVDLCWILARIVRKAGFEAVCATTAELALIEAEQWPIELAIIDCKLTDMDGLMLTEKLKQLQPNVRIMLISGYHFTEDRKIEEWLGNGMVSAFVSKPFEVGVIRDLIAKLIGTEAVPA